MICKEHAEKTMNKILNIDCLEHMRKIPDNFYDLCLTDPPYGIGIDGQKESINKNNPKANRKKYDFKGWDSFSPSKEYFDEIFRISKNQIIWGANYFIDKLQGNTKGWIVWDKGQHGLTMSDCELAFSSFQCPTRIVTLNRVELLLDKAQHPTQKPLKLFEYCIREALKKSDIKTVFDPFAGSGTSLVISKSLGLDYVGCELDKDYYEIINKRLSQVQGSLF